VRSLVDIRAGERRAVAGGFLVLFGIMAAHTLVETGQYLAVHSSELEARIGHFERLRVEVLATLA